MSSIHHDFSWTPSLWSLPPSVPVWTQYFQQVNRNGNVPDDIYTCNGANPMAWMPSFDDGPSPYTRVVSDYFSNKGLTTTFFTIGSCVVDYPDQMLAAYRSGHEIAIHTWSHPDLTAIKDDNQIISELVYSARAIYEITGQVPRYFRPPMGRINERVRKLAASMGLTSIQYIDSHDWEFYKDATKLNQVVSGNFKTWINQGLKNQISLQHDMFESEASIANTVMDMLLKAGYQLEPLSKCLGVFSPYGNDILEGFFKSGQFDNKRSVVLPPKTQASPTPLTTVAPTLTEEKPNSTISSTLAGTSFASSTAYAATVNTISQTTRTSGSRESAFLGTIAFLLALSLI